jgi:WD40 repeat protein
MFSYNYRQSKVFGLMVLLFVFFVLNGCNELQSRDTTTDINTKLEHSMIKIAAIDQIQRISSVAFSKDGRYALSGSEDNKIRLWDLSSGELMRTFKGHTDVVTSVSFSPKTPNILSGSKDNTMRLWDRNNGNLLHKFEHSALVKSVSFSPDGRYALSGSYDNTIRLWELNKWGFVKIFKGKSDKVRSVAFSPDGKSIVSGSADNTIRLWNVDSGVLMRTFKGHSDNVYSVSFSHDGSEIITGSWDKTVRLFHTDGKLLQIFKGHLGDIFSVSFSPNGNRIVSGGNDGFFLWKRNSNKHIAQIIVFKDDEWVTFMPKGFFIASPNGGQKLSISVGGKEIPENYPHHRPDLVKEELAK